MYSKQLKILKDHVCEEDMNMLSHLGAFIAGGFWTSIFTRTEINDVDIYFPNIEALIHFLAYAIGEDDYASDVRNYPMFAVCHTDKSVTLVEGETKYQLICFDCFESPQDIFDRFDFTINMASYDCALNELVLHEDFLPACAERQLRVNPQTKFPIASLIRIKKYSERGYQISRKEIIKLGLSCSELNIKTWDDAIEQANGFYGGTECPFDLTKEFSMGELYSQIETIEYKEIKSNPSAFEEVASQIHLKFNQEEDKGKPWRCGYFYKKVRDDLTSYYRSGSQNIYYAVDSIVNGGEKGIYVWPQTYDYGRPCGNEKIIELELINGELKDDHPFDTELRLVGDVRVVRIVESDAIPDPYDYLKRYLIEDLES